MEAIRLRNLTKTYAQRKAVDDISFSITSGKIVGVVGANGAGKTTLLEMMMGLRKPTSGTVELLGVDMVREGGKAKEKLGVLLQEQCIYKKAKVIEVIHFFHDLYVNPLDVEEVLDMVNLQEYRQIKIKNLSGGLRQRVALAIAIISNPEVLFLDEPTTGLDPEARRDLWKAILQFKKESKTIILSSHYMDEVQRYCDEVIILKKGHVVQKNIPQVLVSRLGEHATMEDVYIQYAIEEEDNNGKNNEIIFEDRDQNVC